MAMGEPSCYMPACVCAPKKGERKAAVSLSLDSVSLSSRVQGRETHTELKKLGSQAEFTSLGKETQRTFGNLGAEDTGIDSLNYINSLLLTPLPTPCSEPSGATNMCDASIPLPPAPERILIPIVTIPLPRGVLDLGRKKAQP